MTFLTYNDGFKAYLKTSEDPVYKSYMKVRNLDIATVELYFIHVLKYNYKMRLLEMLV